MTRQSIQKVEAQLRQKEKEIYSIQKIGQALSNTLKLDDLLNLIMKEITDLMRADRSTLYLVDHQKKEIWSKIALKAEVKEIRQKFGRGISGVVAATGEKINIPDAYRDSRFDPTTDKKTGYQTRSILCIPVWEPTSQGENRETLGVIQVLNKLDGYFTPEDEGILEAIASQVAISISNARLYQSLEKKYREIDLLYEFEQMLSAEFDVREIFRKMLEKTLQHLGGKLAAVVYPYHGQIQLLALNDKGQVSSQQLRELDERLIGLLRGGKVSKKKDFKDIWQKYFPGIGQPDLVYLQIIPLALEENLKEPAALFFQREPASSREFNSDDVQLLGIVEQKISRALELQALRETLLRQERLSAVGQMMSTIVHDLRSPVNSIYGFMELLMDENVSAAEEEEFANIIRTEIQTMTNMTNEILDFAKGKTNILPRKCSVNDIVKRFKPEAEHLFRASGIRFALQNNSGKLIHADVEKFTRVLYNIAKNAKEAMAEEGEFIFKIYDSNGKVIFELADDGPGIPEEIRDRLFESFVTSGKESGTGLGLAIVKKIVDEHGGEIEIKSNKERGTVFYIKIPEYKRTGEV